MTSPRPGVAAPPRLFYGWVVVGASTCMVAAGVGVGQSFAVFVEPLAEAFGASRSGVSLVYSLHMAVFGASSVLMGALADRYGTRRVALMGGALYAVGLLITGAAQTIWHFALAFGLVAGTGVGALHSPLSYLAAKWFDRRKGLAMGIVLSGTGLGIMLASPFARYAMARWGGWRPAILLLGGAALATILVAGTFLRDDPRLLGLAPDGRPASPITPSASTAAGAGGAPGGWTTATAVRTRPFWLLLATFFFCCTSHSGPTLHAVACMTGRGLTARAAAGMMSLFGGASIVGRIGMGRLADWMGGKPSLLISLAVQAAAAWWISGAESPAAFAAFAVLFGLAFGGVYAQYPVITREYFGATGVGAVYGSQMFLSQLGMAVGGLATGTLYDLTGGYRGPFLVNALSGLLALALALGLARPQPPNAPPTTTA